MAQLFKEELRKEIKAKRKLINIDCQMLVENLMKTQEYKRAKNIMTKKFYLPKIDGENLLCCPYGEGDELCVSCFKTFEPVTEACDKNIVDLVIVPALCCDKINYRLGYGGGFYGKTAVCLPEELIVETVYPEAHDISVDLVITENYM